MHALVWASGEEISGAPMAGLLGIRKSRRQLEKIQRPLVHSLGRHVPHLLLVTALQIQIAIYLIPMEVPLERLVVFAGSQTLLQLQLGHLRLVG